LPPLEHADQNQISNTTNNHTMADKFPALDTIDHELPSVDGADSDFLSRESELLGDEFKTEQDRDVLVESDDEINDFKEQFPEVDESVAAEQVEQEDDDEFEGFADSTPQANQYEGESKHLEEWKQRRELEISERENANSKKKEEIISEAQLTIDDFYDNYNNKKEQHTKEVLKEQETFFEKRDGFLKNGTLWDRVGQLIDEVGDLPENEDRDKTRFKGLLKKLKGKENVPGAGGY
jgi:hypothetical protein